jgi:DNA-binding response OmpR family regulator
MLKDVQDVAVDSGPVLGAVAVLCAQPRFRRILRLSLEGDARQVVEWDQQHVRLYVSRLRRKIEADPDRPKHLLTRTGIGYLFAGAD